MTRPPRSPGSTLVLRLNQETVHDFILLFMPPCGHRVPRTKPTCLLHTWRPHRRQPFALVLHLHQHQSSRNLHLQYLAKNQSIQRCQSLITQGSDHPPVLEPHMVLTKTSAIHGISTSSYDSTPSLLTTLGAQVYTTTPRPLCCKRPPGPGTSLRTTLLQDPALTATNGSRAAQSDKGL
jgi:hypothetical protein